MSPPPKVPVADAVLTFLSSVGRRSEAELYLTLFRELPKESFAVLAPGAPVVRQGVGGLVEQIRFLGELGLVAPVVLGLFDADRAAPLGERLLRRFESAQVAAEIHGSDAAGIVDTLRERLRAGVIPIVVMRSDTALDARLAWLADVTRALGTRKLVLLRRRGGLGLLAERRVALVESHQIPLEGSTVSLVNLRTDADVLAEALRGLPDSALVQAVHTLLAMHERLVVSVTSPLDLLRELFTVKGAGTLIKRGSAILRHASYAELDVPRLERLFELSFGRPLAPGYFERAPRVVFVEQEYRGAAIVFDTPIAPYLSKFAVEPLARGEGMGRDLWTRLTRELPRVFWRTRTGNPTQQWYVQMCDGFVRTPGWQLFWRDVASDQIPAMVEYAAGLADDFDAEPG
ncbi:MAG: hypothetical protein KF718_15970 [Polyangiaceae bacterium]|nr:hypothetical protein [Polyangiaceae bacterium]